MNLAPVLPPFCPLSGNIHHSQIKHFQQTVIGRKHRFCLGNLAKLTVKSLDGIGCVDQPANLLVEFEVGTQMGVSYLSRAERF